MELNKLLMLIGWIKASINFELVKLTGPGYGSEVAIIGQEETVWDPFVLESRFTNRNPIKNRYAKEFEKLIEEAIIKRLDLTTYNLKSEILSLIDQGFIDSKHLIHFKASDSSCAGSSLMIAIRSQNKEAIDKFLKEGADINFKSNSGSTPLHRAVEVGDLETIDYLLANRVDLEVINRHGCRPLYDIFIPNIQTLEFKSDEKKLEILSRFIEAQMDFNLDSYGGTLFESLLTLTGERGIEEIYDDDLTKFRVALMILGSNQSINIKKASTKFFTNKANIKKLFSVVGYEKEKIIAGCKLYKALGPCDSDAKESIFVLTKHQIELNTDYLDDPNLKMLVESTFKVDEGFEQDVEVCESDPSSTELYVVGEDVVNLYQA